MYKRVMFLLSLLSWGVVLFEVYDWFKTYVYFAEDGYQYSFLSLLTAAGMFSTYAYLLNKWESK